MTPEIPDNQPDVPKPPAPSTAGMTTKVVKGSIWTLAGQVAPLAVSLVATPFTIRLLGAEGYGVLVLIALIPTYLGFADLGMGLASTKFASEAYAAGDADKEARTVRTAAVIALCASIPVASLIFLLSGWLVTLFKVPEHLGWEAATALKVASITFVINLLNSIFNTPQLTRLRMDLNTFVTSGFRMLGIAATPVVIYLGGGILGAVIVLFVAAVLTLAGHIYTSGHLLPNLFEISLDRTAIRTILRFGSAFALSRIAAVLLVNTEKGILGAVVSTTALAHYSVAFTLAGMVTMFSSSMVQSLIPAFSQLQGESSRQPLVALYSRGIRLSLIWLMPAVVVLALIARPFFGLWAGPEFALESTVPFYILLIGLFFNVTAFFPNSAILSAGKADILAKIYWIELVPYCVLVWYLAKNYGAVGAAAAWSIRVIADALVQFILARKTTGVTARMHSIRKLGVPAIVVLIPLGFAILLGSTSASVFLVLALCVTLYFALVLKIGLDSEEADWVKARIGYRLARLRL